HPFEREGGERSIEQRRSAAHIDTAQRGPESQRLARGQPRLDAILMTDVVQPRAMPGDVIGERCGPPGEPAGKRNEAPAKIRRSPRRQARSSAIRSPAGSVTGNDPDTPLTLAPRRNKSAGRRPT